MYRLRRSDWVAPKYLIRIAFGPWRGLGEHIPCLARPRYNKSEVYRLTDWTSMYAVGANPLDAASSELAVELLNGTERSALVQKAYRLGQDLLREFPELSVSHVLIRRAQGYFSDEEYEEASDRPDVLRVFSVATALLELALDSVGRLAR